MHRKNHTQKILLHEATCSIHTISAGAGVLRLFDLSSAGFKYLLRSSMDGFYDIFGEHVSNIVILCGL